MTWIQHPVSLIGKNVSLIPLDESHFETLINLAKDYRIWQDYAIDGCDTIKLKSSLETSLIERKSGMQYPFVIIMNDGSKMVGSTRFLDIQPMHKKLEIGWTWLYPNYWGTKINLECKLLLLTYCFEEIKAKRVQLKTDENNIRSRKAIDKIGEQYEGVLRNDMIKDDGSKRNSAYYSIINTEWESVKSNLINILL